MINDEYCGSACGIMRLPEASRLPMLNPQPYFATTMIAQEVIPRTGVSQQTLNHRDELTGSKKQRIATGEMSLAAVFKSRHGSSGLVSLFQRLYLAEFNVR